MEDGLLGWWWRILEVQGKPAGGKYREKFLDLKGNGYGKRGAVVALR